MQTERKPRRNASARGGERVSGVAGKMRRLLRASVLVALLWIAVCSSQQSVAVNWNRQAMAAILAATTSDDVPSASHVMALVNVAMYDAVTSVTEANVALGSYAVVAPSGASADGAALAAAYAVLADMYPDQLSTFDAQYAADLAWLPPNTTTSMEAGLQTGLAVAALLLSDRNGTLPYTPYPGSSAAGAWRPTPPTFAPALAPQWGSETTWCVANVSAFVPPSPPELSSAAYTSEHNDVFSLGRQTGSSRTAAQTSAANFWSARPNDVVVWSTVVTDLVEARGLSLSAATRVLTSMSVALADATIAAWQGLYQYGRWRPVTAIRWANTTGNAALAFDPLWRPLANSTPSEPEYACEAAILAGAASEVLATFFGAGWCVGWAAACGNLTGRQAKARLWSSALAGKPDRSAGPTLRRSSWRRAKSSTVSQANPALPGRA